VHVAETHHLYLPRTGGPLPPTQTDEELKKRGQALLDYEVEQIKQAGGTSRRPTCASGNRTRRCYT